jgi:hypothetical protein
VLILPDGVSGRPAGFVLGESDLKMGAINESDVNILNNVFGAKLRAIKGYPGGNDVNLAVERREVDRRCNLASSTLVATWPE